MRKWRGGRGIVYQQFLEALVAEELHGFGEVVGEILG
jgi:hypothetical protein